MFIAGSGCWRQVLILFAMFLAGSGAVAAPCPPPGGEMPKPAVRLEVGVAEPVVHNHRSRDEIAVLAGRTPVEGRLDAGLTRTETQLAVTPTVKLYKQPGGGACVILAEVEASWRMIHATIDVAAEYRPGSCEHAVVLDHEREHVRLTRRAFEVYGARMEARLREQAAALKPFQTGDVEGAAQVVTDRMMNAARQVMDQFKAESRRANAAIDTPESYRTVSAKCRKW